LTRSVNPEIRLFASVVLNDPRIWLNVIP
jgi:hypothetical protein